MKTEVSIPSPICEAAKRLAERQGISLSGLYAAALAAYVAAYQNGDISKRLDVVYANEGSTLGSELVAIQIVSISDEKW
jgi:hypothetical protein